ncbi:MAG: GTPase [Candidatus Aenigmatarchaeota archaeon]
MNNPFRNSGGPNAKQLIERGLNTVSVKIEKEHFEDSPVETARQKEGMRIKELGTFFDAQLRTMSGSFPSRYDIKPIYLELADVMFGYSGIESAQTALHRAAKRIKEFQMHYLRKLKYERHTQNMRVVRKEYYGRVVGAIKQNRRHINLLSEAGKTLRKLPKFEDVPTVIIAGLPNVGKTSLLKAMTGSEPEIALYPFTTKGLMLGYAELGFQRVQFIDTPGLLDRPLHKRNKIELQGIAALKHLADLIIYVFDVSETAGYTIGQQKELLRELKKMFKVPIIAVANKVDIVGGHPAAEVDGPPISCETKEGVEELKALIKGRLECKRI